jgi:hypothetical protein
MSVLDDLQVAIENYDTDKCKTEIVNFSIVSGGAVLNEGEIFKFRVRVTNEGHLTMRNVTLQALGTVYADVRLDNNALPWGPSATASPVNLTLGQGESYTTGIFQGRAKLATPGPQDIVRARISQWDASFDHILSFHADYGAAEGKLTKVIEPD